MIVVGFSPLNLSVNIAPQQNGSNTRGLVTTELACQELRSSYFTVSVQLYTVRHVPTMLLYIYTVRTPDVQDPPRVYIRLH